MHMQPKLATKDEPMHNYGMMSPLNEEAIAKINKTAEE